MTKCYFKQNILDCDLSPVMLSPRGQSGIEAKILASASALKLWPRPQTFGLG